MNYKAILFLSAFALILASGCTLPSQPQQPVCGNSVCENGESIAACPADCAPAGNTGDINDAQSGGEGAAGDITEGDGAAGNDTEVIDEAGENALPDDATIGGNQADE